MARPGCSRRARLHQRHPGLSLLEGALYQVYAAPGQITDIALEPASSSSAPAPSPPAIRCAGSSATPRAGPGKRTRPHPRQADPPGPRHQSRHQHRPAHLSSRAAFRREDLHGVGLLGVSARPADRPAPTKRGGRSRRAGRHRRGHQRAQFPLPIEGDTPPGGRCARSTTAPGVHRVPARHPPGRDAAALGDRPRGRRRARQLPRPADHMSSTACSPPPNCGWAATAAEGRIVRTDGRPRW